MCTSVYTRIADRMHFETHSEEDQCSIAYISDRLFFQKLFHSRDAFGPEWYVSSQGDVLAVCLKQSLSESRAFLLSRAPTTTKQCFPIWANYNGFRLSVGTAGSLGHTEQ